jgi:hypothetical protein
MATLFDIVTVTAFVGLVAAFPLTERIHGHFCILWCQALWRSPTRLQCGNYLLALVLIAADWDTLH